MIAQGLTNKAVYAVRSPPSETTPRRTARYSPVIGHPIESITDDTQHGIPQALGPHPDEAPRRQWPDTTTNRAMIVIALVMLSTSLIVMQFGDSQILAVTNVAVAMIPLIQVIVHGWHRE